jgi:PAS domain S-box-containing protein
MTDDPNSHLAKAPDEPPKHIPEASHWDQMEKREGLLWRYILGILIVMALGLAVTSWETFRVLPMRLEALPIGLVVLVALFGVYVWHQRKEVIELRSFLRGMKQRADAPVTEAQIEKMLDVMTRSQRGYRDLIDSLDHLVFNLGLDGSVKTVNKRFAETLNLSFQEIVGHTLQEFISEPPIEEVQASVSEFLEKRTWSGVVRVRFRKSGEVRFYDTVLQPVLKDGEVVGASGVARDITAYRESELRFTELFESLQEGVYFTTPGGMFLEANPALVRMLGFEKKEDLLAIPAPTLYEDRTQREWMLDELDRSGAVKNHEISLKRPDGKVIRCLDSCSVIRDSSGDVVRLQGTLVDITERVEIERRLYQEQEFGRSLVECFPDLIVVLDVEGRYTFVSPRCEELIGVLPADLIGRQMGERAHPEDARHLSKQLDNLLAGITRSARMEYRVRHEDGSYRAIRVTASPMTDSDGRMTGVVASARDVTEEKHIEQQLLQTEKFAAMGQMLAGVAHELNNPLTAILGVTDLLHERSVDDTMRRQTSLVHKQARRAADIVQSLLAFSRRTAPVRARIRIEDIVERVLELHGKSLMEKKIEVKFYPAENLPAIEGDANLLLQVFLNLIINSEQAIAGTKDHGTITIAAEPFENNVSITVEDDGPGIPADITNRVFDPFFTTKRPGGGTGLGLTICMAIIREHGGTIETQSVFGSGASIRIDLPVANSLTVAGVNDGSTISHTPSFSPALQGHTVLVVDDEDGIRELVAEGLVARGMSVETVTTSEDALAMLAHRQFDAILCDYNLPGQSGEQLFDILCEQSNGNPPRFVFMTGDLLESRVVNSIASRGARTIQKPFQLAGLANLLAEVLEAQPAKTS